MSYNELSDLINYTKFIKFSEYHYFNYLIEFCYCYF